MADWMRRIVYQVKYSYKASIFRGLQNEKSVSYILSCFASLTINYTITYQGCFHRSHRGLFFPRGYFSTFLEGCDGKLSDRGWYRVPLLRPQTATMLSHGRLWRVALQHDMDNPALYFALDCSHLSVIIPPIERRGELP
jgi:hypothetical protein